MSHTDHSHYSSLREKILEHIFFSQVLGVLWRMGRRDIEVSRSEVDRGGHDIILECNGVVRHVQLKTSYLGSSTASQKVNLDLAKKPSGCVVWVNFDADTLVLGPYLFFGGGPNEKLPELSMYKVAKHSKGNAQGVKNDRSNHRVIPKGCFDKLETIEDLVGVMFGLSEVDSSPIISVQEVLSKSAAKDYAPPKLEIEFIPGDEVSFKEDLIRKKCAHVLLYMSNGDVNRSVWQAKKFSLSSNLRGNLFSGYLRGWRNKGIRKAVFSIDEIAE